MKIWYLYMIRCKDDSLYTGITLDYSRRFKEHESGKGAKYCKIKGVKSLVALWEIGDSKSLACKVEYYFKKKSKKEKEILIKKMENLEILFEKSKNKDEKFKENHSFKFLSEEIEKS